LVVVTGYRIVVRRVKRKKIVLIGLCSDLDKAWLMADDAQRHLDARRPGYTVAVRDDMGRDAVRPA
jgi:hypothetical protein